MTNKTEHSPVKSQRRVFGYLEVVFNLTYLLTVLILFFFFLFNSAQNAMPYSAAASIVLFGGDLFHLLPRLYMVIRNDSQRISKALGIGKLITSITMTIFYVFLWQIWFVTTGRNSLPFMTALLTGLVTLRVLLCLAKQNRWTDEAGSPTWGIIRNIPFFLIGIIVAAAYLFFGNSSNHVLIGIAILLSFVFYTPVVLRVNENRKLGMLMLPKSIMYVWILLLLINI